MRGVAHRIGASQAFDIRSKYVPYALRQNVAGRVFGYGTVELEIGTSNGPVSLTHMPLRGLHEHLVQRVLAVADSSREADDRRAL